MDLLMMIIPFVVIAVLMVYSVAAMEGKIKVYLAAIIATLSAWFVGLLLDANIDFGEPVGFLSFRILLPILAMGVSILKVLMKDKES